jgi:hypothetical protein
MTLHVAGVKSQTGEKKAMRYSFVVLVVALCLGTLRWPLNASASTTEQTAAVDFAQRAVPRALDYDQGKRASLIDAQDDFTPEGWGEFMKWLDGYLDDRGAPTGSSLFTATGETVVKRLENGVIRLSIPGTLKQQTQNAYGGISTTTYRVTVDIQVGGNPLKIQHLKTRTCGATPCQ